MKWLKGSNGNEQIYRKSEKYLENRKIRQTYVSLMTGWDKSRVSKILSGTIDLKNQKPSF